MSAIPQRADAEHAETDAPVLMNVRDHVAVIELNRPDAANSLNLDMCEALTSALTAAAENDQVSAVWLSGRGRMFCAGGDVTAMAASPDPAEFLRDLAGAAHDAVRVLRALRKPVVTTVQGSAAGAGLSLVLSSDIVIAGEKAKFLTAYTTVGLTPDCGLSWTLPRVIGVRRALDLTLRPRVLSAAEALDWGMLSDVVPEAELDSAAAAALADVVRPGTAVGEARALVWAGLENSFDQHLDLEATTISAMAATPETRASLAAFTQRGNTDRSARR